jgi:hypothetical protein
MKQSFDYTLLENITVYYRKFPTHKKAFESVDLITVIAAFQAEKLE